MADRELLELAAKAAGLRVICHASYPQGGVYVDDMEDDWNPLADDGDALRLAVRCDIALIPPGSSIGKKGVFQTDVFDADCQVGDDPTTAARRAIVLAAAELGKGMT